MILGEELQNLFKRTHLPPITEILNRRQTQETIFGRIYTVLMKAN
jgi:hypothetical protein